MLHEYREQAFQRNEDMIQFLCNGDKDGFLNFLESKKQKRPVLRYSATYDKFIISPLDDAATLSMKVSVQSAPFHRRPVSILDSDPHWQRFLESTVGKGSEHGARLASYEDDLNKWDEKEGEDVNQLYEEEGGNVSECAEEVWEDVDSCDDKEGDDVTKCAGKEPEDAQDECVPGTCNVSVAKNHDETETGDAITVNDTESPNEELELLKNNCAWYEWKLACMKGSLGTPRDADSHQFMDIPPAITAKVTEDIAEVWRMQEETWAEYPKQFAIVECEASIGTLEVEIAHRKKAMLEGRTRGGRKEETLPEPITAGQTP